MRKVIVEIDSNYDGVLSLTAIGSSGWQTCVAATAVDLSKCCHVSIGADGKWIQHPMKDGEGE